jgi:hypothetical protein
MKFSTVFLFLVVVLTIMIKRNAECISVVKLSRLNQNMLKKLIGLRKGEESLEEEEDQLPKIENKNKKRERQVQEDNERFFGHYYEPRVGILNFYGSF